MTPDLIAITERFGPALANHLWQSTCFAALIWLLTLLLRRDRAQARHLLWFAASVKFLIPFSLLIGLGAHSLKLKPHRVPLAAAISTSVNAVEQPFSGWPQSVDATYSPAPSAYSNWLVPTLALVWLLGTAVVAIVWFLRWRSASGLLRKALPSESGPEVESLRRLEYRTGIRQRIALLRSPAMNEPGVFGILRPVLLWPEQLTERLKQENLDSILAHELIHVRRRDNLTAAIHAVAETLFWFHPAVWWIGSRMIAEREQACDEAAVQLVSKPDIYAESLLTACRFCVESPAACVSSISGADLSKRVFRIMSNQMERKMGIRRKIAVIATAITCLGAPLALGMFGVTQDHAGPSEATLASLPKFDVASIKPHKDDPASGVMVGMRFTPDGVTISGMPLYMLIREAFGVADDRVQGTPGWAKSERFDIDAKVSAEDVAALGKVKMQDRKTMLLPLLEDRFGLKYHHETKELQVYTLVIAKGGPKLLQSKATADDSNGGKKQMTRRSTEGMSMEGVDAPMENLAHTISMQLGATVIDRTGLTGRFDYTLKWVPDQGMSMMPKGPVGASEPDSGSTTPTGPSLVTALQEQLGLKLETKKEPVDVIVIDQITQPTPN